VQQKIIKNFQVGISRMGQFLGERGKNMFRDI